MKINRNGLLLKGCILGLLAACIFTGCEKEQNAEVTEPAVPSGIYVCEEDESHSVTVSDGTITLTNADFDEMLPIYRMAEYCRKAEQLSDEGLAITAEKQAELEQEITESFDPSVYAGQTYEMKTTEERDDGETVIWLELLDESGTEVSGLSGSYWPEDGSLWIAGSLYHKK